LRQAASRPLPRTLGKPADAFANESAAVSWELEWCTHQPRRGLSVLRRPTLGRRQLKPSSCQLGLGIEPLTSATRVGNSQVAAFSTVAVLCESRPSHSCGAWRADGRSFICRPPNPEYQMPEVSTRQRRAYRPEGQSFSPVAVSRSGHLLAQPGPPNISVKGTSCGKPQDAPYVGR